MKKLISVVFFSAALIWTWHLVTGSSSVAFETHAGIQVKMAEMILNAIKNKKPEALDSEITRLWTEDLGDHKIRAVFSYRFTEKDTGGNPVEQTVEGEALLYKQEGETPQQDTWTLQQVKMTNEGIYFSDGATITPNNATMSGSEPIEGNAPSAEASKGSEASDEKISEPVTTQPAAPATEAVPKEAPGQPTQAPSEPPSH